MVLRDYQKVGVDFLLKSAPKGCILADGMGLGKTRQAIEFAKTLNKRTLIVCPSYVRGVWAHYQQVAPATLELHGEIAKWWPNKAVCLPQGVQPHKWLAAQPPMKWYDIVVIHYDILHAWVEELVAWAPKVLILDECHALMSDKSRRSKAVRAVAAVAKWRVGLSGTPMTNRPRDLWNVVDTIRPNALGGFFRYAIRHCAGHRKTVHPLRPPVWDFNGQSNLDELHTKLAPMMLRRTLTDVHLELPAKTRQVINIDVGKTGLSGATLRPGGDRGQLRAALDIAADKKLEAVSGILAEHLAVGSRVVCFTYRRKVAEWLVDRARLEGFEADYIHGGVSQEARQEIVAAAKLQDGAHLLCATIDSASVGIDLSYASVGVFCELTWEPHELLQAEARLHRFGQKNPVLVQYMIASGTSDEIVAGVVVDRLAQFEAAIGPTGESLGAELTGSEDDIMAQIYAAVAGRKDVSPGFDIALVDLED